MPQSLNIKEISWI